MWRNLETVDTPDVPVALEASREARRKLEEARAGAKSKLERWEAQQAQIDANPETPLGRPRSEYRLKYSEDGSRAQIQVRSITP